MSILLLARQAGQSTWMKKHFGSSHITHMLTTQGMQVLNEHFASVYVCARVCDHNSPSISPTCRPFVLHENSIPTILIRPDQILETRSGQCHFVDTKSAIAAAAGWLQL